MSLLTCALSQCVVDMVLIFSVLSDQSRPLVDLWPSHLPRISVPDHAQQRADPKAFVPDTLEGLAEWAYIIRNPESKDVTRRHLLVYTNRTTDCIDPVQVGIRVQGFIQKANLSPTGTWTTCVFLPHTL